MRRTPSTGAAASSSSGPSSRKWSLHPGTIGAWVAEMDFGTAPVVTEALHRAIDDETLGYLSPATAAEMGAATAGVDGPRVRLGRRPGARAPRERRDGRAARRRRGVLARGLGGHRAHPGVHAVPDIPSLDRASGRAGARRRHRRPLGARPRRDRRGLRRRRAHARALQPAQPDRHGARPRRARGHLADRRAARRPRVRRRDPCADPLRRPPPHPLRVRLRCRRRALGHGHERLEGVEHPGPQGGAAHHVERRRRAALPPLRLRHRARGLDPRGARVDRRVRARRRVAAECDPRTSRATARPSTRSCARSCPAPASPPRMRRTWAGSMCASSASRARPPTSSASAPASRSPTAPSAGPAPRASCASSSRCRGRCSKRPCARWATRSAR